MSNEHSRLRRQHDHLASSHSSLRIDVIASATIGRVDIAYIAKHCAASASVQMASASTSSVQGAACIDARLIGRGR
ncbi:hypothetical protein WAE31_21210 (plasmid) [Xanthomonas axonopodis pv. vasculorum]